MAGRASLGGASAPRSLPGGVSRSRRSARAFASGAHAPGSIADWVERELDFGDVSRVSSQGGSAWASFSTLETTSGKRLFVKTSRSGPVMFAGEGAGLRAMHAACVVEDEDSSSSDSSSSTMVIPEVHFAGATPEGCRDGNSCIVMDHLDFGARGDQAAFGRALARMHLAAPLAAEARDEGKFGFVVNNTCGDTPQPNEWCDDWVDFYLNRRIRHQLRLARDGALSDLGERVCEMAPRWFEPFDASNPIRPSILHGDLWSGNIGTVDGRPSVFDPATYYGHNEAEFGMSWCAGFSDAFYDAYHETFPKTEERFEERRLLYRLYHYLNHYNLFGGGYKRQCVEIMKTLLSEGA